MIGERKGVLAMCDIRTLEMRRKLCSVQLQSGEALYGAD